MRQRLAIIFTAALIVGLAWAAIFISTGADRASIHAPRQETDDFSALLDALVVSLPEGPLNESERETFRMRVQKEQQAVEKLRQLGTNSLVRLMEEVRAAGLVEATNRNGAMNATRRLARAFEILGDEARPLLPLLIGELRAGRSIGPSIVGIQFIGGTDAGLALVPGLTNSDPIIRNWTMSALSRFGTDREVAVTAVRPLLKLLGDDSEFSRALAGTVLGSLGQEPEAVIPELLQVARNDSDFVVRASAIKAIGRFGTNAAPSKADLDSIAMMDEKAIVRRIATLAARAASGEISPEEVR